MGCIYPVSKTFHKEKRVEDPPAPEAAASEVTRGRGLEEA